MLLMSRACMLVLIVTLMRCTVMEAVKQQASPSYRWPSFLPLLPFASPRLNYEINTAMIVGCILSAIAPHKQTQAPTALLSDSPEDNPYSCSQAAHIKQLPHPAVISTPHELLLKVY